MAPPIVFIGAAVIVSAAAAALIASRMSKPPSADRVYDPIGTTALMACGTFDDCKTYDTVINAGARFEVLPAKEVLMKLFKEHILPHQQFHSVPSTVPPNSPHAVWTPCASIDLNQHFIDHDSTGTDQTTVVLENIMNDTTSLRAQGASIPWWRVHLIHEAGGVPGAGVMVIAVHHAIGDGISLMQVFGKLLTSDKKGTPLNMAAFSPNRGKSDDKNVTIVGRLLRPWTWPMAILRNIDFVICAIETLIVTAGKLDTPSCFVPGGAFPAGGYKADKVLIPIPNHPLDTIKAIKNACGKGITVNDVEYALYAGMMRRYLLKFGGQSQSQLDQQLYRSLTPFAEPHAVRQSQTFTHTLANTFSFLTARLPVAARSPKDRVNEAHTVWNAFKTRSYYPAAKGLTAAASYLPLSVKRQTAQDVFTRPSVVFSNVPGPTETMHMGGEKITQLIVAFANVIPQVIVVSMGGMMHYTMTMSMSGQAGKESDVRIALPKLFKEEVEELCSQVGVAAPKWETA